MVSLTFARKANGHHQTVLWVQAAVADRRTTDFHSGTSAGNERAIRIPGDIFHPLLCLKILLLRQPDLKHLVIDPKFIPSQPLVR